MSLSLQVEYDGITMEAAPIKPAVSQPALRAFSWVGTLGGMAIMTWLASRDAGYFPREYFRAGIVAWALLGGHMFSEQSRDRLDAGDIAGAETAARQADQSRSLELDPQDYHLHVQLQQMGGDEEIFRTSGVMPPRPGSGSRQT